MKNTYQPRLEALYKNTISKELQKELELPNVMQVPRLEKIVLNVGVKEAVTDSKVIGTVERIITAIAGQASVRTKARKSIAGFKIREGMPLGVKVTLRRDHMYEFLDRLINLSLPMVRDFRGVSKKFDRRGNYNLGIKEWVIFPEVDYDTADRILGLNVSIHTTAKTDAHAYALLKHFGMPFKKD
ncbi:50S ribosomal protein L5 [bacterium]|jgi:large subunit ribosomal protein L5|nr:50S ribosomal protein L5 [bacterium]